MDRSGERSLRVLVTGATGLLGCSLLGELQAQGVNLLSHARASTADFNSDLSDEHAVRAMLDASKPNVVVHLAAWTDVDGCEKNPDRCYAINVRPVELISTWIHRQSPQTHLVHISSDQLYDGDGPHAENSVCLRNTYAFSKIASEIAARAVGSTVLRTNFFGPSRRPGRSSFSDWIYLSSVQGFAIDVFDDVLFSPLALDTLAQCLVSCVRDRPSGVFNLGSRKGMSKADFAFAFAEAAGISSAAMRRRPSAGVQLAATRPKDMRMDVRRYEAEMGVDLPALEDEIYRIGRIYHEYARP